MQTPAYMNIESETQGLITAGNLSGNSVGNTWNEGLEDYILVTAFEHSIEVPTDPQSGQPSGQRIHNPISITKIFDRSTPLLYSALVRGERLTQCSIKWFRTNASGRKEHYFSHILEDAIIIKIKYLASDNLVSTSEVFPPQEKVSISYRKLKIRHELDGSEADDDWQAPYTS